MKKLILAATILLLAPLLQAAELAGVFVKDQVAAENGQTLVLNGMGLREKLWIDVYVGSLYLVNKSDNVTEILSALHAMRIQMDFVYKKVAKKKLLKAWREGFEKNQSKEMLDKLQGRIDQFYGYFDQDVVAKDQYLLDYIPGKGTTVTKNDTVLGLIPGEDFKNALMEIWLGNFPTDKKLKLGMLGLK
ncbi:MAG: chalcone isomerase family protein [Gammaproteobacteria bacterium]